MSNMENKGYKLQYLDESYENLTGLGIVEEKDCMTYLVRNRDNGKIAVKKYVDVSAIPIYKKISEIKDGHIERVLAYADDGIKGVVITEYISGITLGEYLEEYGRIPEETAVCMIKDLLLVLSRVHSENIVHRDINPSNIMISNDGVLKLIDFGIARQKKENQSRDTKIWGTAGYAAPEQFGFFQTDGRADIYAVGILLNKLLTGRLPGEEKYYREPLRGIIEKCIQIDADQRYQTAGEVLYALNRMEDNNRTEKKRKETKEFNEIKKISWLPGFRTGVAWKNVVATIGYFMMVLSSTIFIGECVKTWQAFLLESCAVFIYIWLSTLLAANIFQWDEKVIFIKDLSKPTKITLRVILWLVLFDLGTTLEKYVHYDLLGFVKK